MDKTIAIEHLLHPSLKELNRPIGDPDHRLRLYRAQHDPSFYYPKLKTPKAIDEFPEFILSAQRKPSTID